MSVDSRALLMVTFSSNNTCQSLKPVYVHILCPGESSFFFSFFFSPFVSDIYAKMWHYHSVRFFDIF